MKVLRKLIIISVLLVSVTVQASGVDELVRIKQNWFLPVKIRLAYCPSFRLFNRKQRFRIRLW